MTRFEFLYVLISIIVAVAVTDMVSSWGALLRRRAVVRFYWVHVAWAVLILFIVMQYWWGFWQYHVIEDWSFFAMAALIGNSILLAFTVSVITPDRRVDAPVDLQAFFYEISPMFFSLSAMLMFALALVNLFVGERPLLSADNAIRAVAISVAMLGATTRSTLVHSLLVGSGFVLLTLFILMQVAR